MAHREGADSAELSDREKQAVSHGHAHAAYGWGVSSPPVRHDRTAWSESELAAYRKAYADWHTRKGVGLKRPLGLVLWDIVASLNAPQIPKEISNGSA